MGLALLGQDMAQGLLGAGLAHRARHRHDLGVRAGAGGGAEADHRGQHGVGTDFRHRQHRSVCRQFRRAGLAHHRGAGPAAEGVGHEIVAVTRIAADREEQVAGLERAGVD